MDRWSAADRALAGRGARDGGADMIPGSPAVGPTACEGYQAVATDGSYFHVARVHWPRLRRVRSSPTRATRARLERSPPADQPGCPSRDGPSHRRAPRPHERGREGRATGASQGHGGEARPVCNRLHGDATLALQAARAELDGNLAKRDAYLARLTEDGSFKEKP